MSNWPFLCEEVSWWGVCGGMVTYPNPPRLTSRKNFPPVLPTSPKTRPASLSSKFSSKTRQSGLRSSGTFLYSKYVWTAAPIAPDEWNQHESLPMKVRRTHRWRSRSTPCNTKTWHENLELPTMVWETRFLRGPCVSACGGSPWGAAEGEGGMPPPPLLPRWTASRGGAPRSGGSCCGGYRGGKRRVRKEGGVVHYC